MENKNNQKKKKNPDYMRRGIYVLAVVMGIIWLTSLFGANMGGFAQRLKYPEFYHIVENNIRLQKIQSLVLRENLVQGQYSQAEGAGYFYVYIPKEDKEIISLMRENVDDFEVRPPATAFTNFLYFFGPMLIFILFLWYFSRKGSQMGSQIWGFGKTKISLDSKSLAKKVTFKDVSGIDEAKEELEEVVEFLKDPKKFQRLGGRFPKGVLLMGPPGCGKTLLAKAVSGEAKVPFFSIGGSDFVEMFVGVGASRVRSLFDQAKKAAKVENKGCIIFIDEIDAVGRQRFAGLGGGHDEREQTLNQLLAEMDGFKTETGVIVIAATNRPDVLDPALLRPGRFDRQIVINAPDIKGREGILKVHTKGINLSTQVDLKEIAKRTPGFSGADLENLCNEAALLAARRNKKSVNQKEMEEAIERVIMGPERKSRIISKEEKKITAFHEGGHALLSLLVPGVDPMAKVSIIPRGMAGGYTFIPPQEDRSYRSKKQLMGEITVILGGRASEEVNLGDVTTGAVNDLATVSKIARKMVCDYGMSQRLGNYTLGESHGPVFLGRDMMREKDYSEETARVVDEEVKKIVDECYSRAKKIIEENKSSLAKLVEVLLEKEVLSAEEFREITGLPKKQDS